MQLTHLQNWTLYISLILLNIFVLVKTYFMQPPPYQSLVFCGRFLGNYYEMSQEESGSVCEDLVGLIAALLPLFIG